MRVGILLVPALAYLGKHEHGPWAARMGLVASFRRGLLVGVGVSLLWLIPQAITRWKSGHAFSHAELPFSVWLNAIVGSPFGEELVYRQIVFRNLSERLSLWKAVAGSALWFTLLHIPAAVLTSAPMEMAQYLAVIFAYGVVFACLYSLARSLWAPLIPHVVNNVFYAVAAGQS